MSHVMHFQCDSCGGKTDSRAKSKWWRVGLSHPCDDDTPTDAPIGDFCSAWCAADGLMKELELADPERREIFNLIQEARECRFQGEGEYSCCDIFARLFHALDVRTKVRS